MKVLVVGGNGFIGSHLVDGLLAREWETVVLDIRERRYDALSPQVRFIRGGFGEDFLVREALVGVDVVFHLAWTTIHETANQDLTTDVRANLIPSIRLIEACQRVGVLCMD
jgi:UDP-glucose 4-epimerase